MTWVVDASVAVKWVVPESLSEHADRLLGSEDPLMAPDLLMIEAANALWKKARREELPAAEAARALALAQRLDHPVSTASTSRWLNASERPWSLRTSGCSDDSRAGG